MTTPLASSSFMASSSMDSRLIAWSSIGYEEDEAGGLSIEEPPPTGELPGRLGAAFDLLLLAGVGGASAEGMLSLAMTTPVDMVWVVRCFCSARCRCCSIFCRRLAADVGVASMSSSPLAPSKPLEAPSGDGACLCRMPVELDCPNVPLEDMPCMGMLPQLPSAGSSRKSFDRNMGTTAPTAALRQQEEGSHGIWGGAENQATA
mmetsp:Transcript_74352/g.231779  ORF Transcript_74352/g.231779 Transcript_74352/m.231779 type:complete len:204 (-) Transcript_74352:7-618(-)